jgi:CxxC-x17-CxxC domain-containing protein
MTAYQGGGFQRKMFDVSSLNIKCKECGVEIKELPFQPREDRLDDIYCRECNFKRKKSFRRDRF